jgi:penicillin amidase
VFDKLERVNALVKLGSYGFVLSGDYTESRNPALYAASQLDFEAPSTVAEGSIRAGGLHASGEIIPGIPMIVDCPNSLQRLVI